MEVKEKQKRGQKRWLLLLLLLLLLLVVGFAAWFFWGRGATVPTIGNGSPIPFDDAAQNGNLPGKPDAEIQAALNEIVEEGMFNISISPEITFADGTSKGDVLIENIEANHYHMQVTITLDEGGTIVYESGAIKPGQYIESIKLTEDLSAGTYPATATFTALNQETMEKVGTAAAKITLIVQK
jgi:hypothetical protein